MTAKSSEWRPGPTVCRCCLSEGCYKDISTEYFWMGKREVYAEMLSDTLSVSIAYSTSGGPNSNSRLICEPCISRLRDASEFKRQVVECERMFMQHLDPGSSHIPVEVQHEPLEPSVKLERVKLEKNHSDDDFDDRHDDAFDDEDDDLDDQPLTKLASKVPKKESVDLLDLLDNTKAAEKRKSTTKSKAPPAKKLKKKEPPKPTTSKTKPEKKKKEQNPMTMARRNAQVIVQNTTAYPFKLPECTMVCVYCQEAYPESADFRAHMEAEHQECKIRVAFSHINEGYIKVDCTDLKCRICMEKFDKIEDGAEHLLKTHNKNIDLSFDLGVQPFRFVTDQLLCAMCPEKFPTLRSLSRHTQSHFRKCTCELCGKSYLTTSSLQHHMRFTHSVGADQKICEKCRKTFDSCEAKRKHLSESPKCWRYSCRICYSRFMSSTLRDAHQNEAHGIQKRSYVCPECREVFPDAMKYRVHFKVNHTDRYFACSCGRKFDSKNNLERHRVSHTKEKLFPCPECSKAFPRKHSLVAHMWIHSENKRYECKLCNKPFNQKVSWKTHMKSYHPDLEMDF